MDSAKDVHKQCEAGPSNCLLRNKHQFCELPSCLGTPWHKWGCCSLHLTDLNDYEALTEKDEHSALLLVEAPTRMCELSSKHSRYAFPKTDEEIKRGHEESVPTT